MREIIKKSFLLGLGAASLTKSHAEKIVKELVKRNEMTINEGKELLGKVNAAAMEERKRISSFIEQEAKRISGKLGVASYARVENLKKKLRSIDRELIKEGKKTLNKIAKQLSK